jgi:hypothetical protein
MFKTNKMNNMNVKGIEIPYDRTRFLQKLGGKGTLDINNLHDLSKVFFVKSTEKTLID